MTKRIIALIMAFVLILSLGACGSAEYSIGTNDNESIKLTFNATFYDNNGGVWLSATGNSFDIRPNKVKEYSYSTSGDWISEWSISSVVSVDIDGKSIESCGSTIIFADTRLKQYDIELPEEIDTSTNGNSSIKSKGRWSDYFTLQWLWDTKDIQNRDNGAKAVVIQSQNGDPICMFTGSNVSWDIAAGLPKTTMLTIDGKEVYIHRTNFAIIDAELLK